MELNEGIKLSEDFLNTEIRCDYTVTAKQKKVWAVQIDLLYRLLEVCQKHNIKVIAYAGTILGAIRHKGFIPWDDDIDVALTRTEYEKLLKVAPQEFEEPYFFQTALSDKEFFLGYARLRNSNTTGIITDSKSVNYNNGIYIDVFVLDSYTRDELKFEKQIQRRDRFLFLFDSYHLHKVYESAKPKILSRIIHYTVSKIIPYRFIVALYNKNLTKFNKNESRISLMTHEVPFIRKYWCDLSDFNDILYVPFESIMIPIPKNYDKLLKHMYGNYMDFPPKDKRGAWHEGQLLFEPDIPYKEFISSKKDED